MNLAACAAVPQTSHTGTYHRATMTRYWGASLRTTHTRSSRSRFNNGTPAAPTYEILYLADDPVVAWCEVQAILGSIWVPGGSVARATAMFPIASVSVTLQRVVDLTTPMAQAYLATHAQELTGDWQGYHLRGPLTPIAHPAGVPAPTQQLGAALYGVPDLEGFLTYSARVLYHRALVVFPTKLKNGSSLSASDGDTLP